MVIGPENDVLSDGAFDYSYDAEGNLIQKAEIASGNVTAFMYDFRNRLTDVVERDNSGQVLHQSHYVYDVFDRRIIKVVDGVASATLYDHDQAWADFDAAGDVKARYLVFPRFLRNTQVQHPELSTRS